MTEQRTKQITELSGAQWQQILEILGTGHFIGISFRPPTEDEKILGNAQGWGDWGWWICEAEYHDIESDQGQVTKMQHIVRKFPFKLYDAVNE